MACDRSGAVRKDPVGRGWWTLAAFLVVVVMVLGRAPAAVAQWSRDTPEAAGGAQAARPDGPVFAKTFMVVTANPLASGVARDILRAGGSAADAAIAAQLVLGLVEPQSSGLGGGALALHWDASRKALRTYDGREAAPASARPDRFLKDGKPMPFARAVRSGLSVGVPGTVRFLETLHRRHGRLPWPDLFAPAIKMAREGFAVSPRLAHLLANDRPETFSPQARAYFFDPQSGGRPAGFRLENPDYARTLERIAAGGADAFYTGPIADAVVAAVARATPIPGDVSLGDLAAYVVKERAAVCVPYRTTRVCGMGPPSSGGIAIGQALMMLDGFSLGAGPRAALSPGALHLMAEALKLAFADRNRYVADTDFVDMPDGLLDPGYIGRRRARIDRFRPARHPPAGIPPGRRRVDFGVDATFEASGTSHISIVDRDGNAVSMTTTIEAGFGSGIWAGGFLLNNELTDFSFRPVDGSGRAIANAVGAGKRPRSSMSPTLVFDRDGRLSIIAGSPGGSRIIPYVLKALVGLIDWKLDPQAAVSLRNFSSPSAALELEAVRAPVADLLAHARESFEVVRLSIGLRPLGQSVVFKEMTSGLGVIMRQDAGGWMGGADPRREGLALGD
ncbi:MAG: gamma-glutamyltransferase family protein [Hyphomicrobiaceae bacterium]